MKITEVKSGAHVGELRRWVQWNARNGDCVKWGSQEIVALKPQTMHELEILAQQIKDAITSEQKHTIERIKETLKKLLQIKEFEYEILRALQDVDSLQE